MDTKWKKWANSICIVAVIISMVVAGVVGVNQFKKVASSNEADQLVMSGEYNLYFDQVINTAIFEMFDAGGMLQESSVNGGDGSWNIKPSSICTGTPGPNNSRLPAGIKVKAKMNYKYADGEKKTETLSHGTLDTKSDNAEKYATTIKLKKRAKEHLSEHMDDTYEGPRVSILTVDGPYKLDVKRGKNSGNGNIYFPYEAFYMVDMDKQYELLDGVITITYGDNFVSAIKESFDNQKVELESATKLGLGLFIYEFVAIILLIILFAFQKKRTKFFAAIDRIWYEVILFVGGMILLFALLSLNIVDESSISNLEKSGMEAAFVDGVFVVILANIVMVLAVCIQTTVWRLKEHKLLDSTLCLGWLRRYIRRTRDYKEMQYEAMEFVDQRVHDHVTFRKRVRGILICTFILGFFMVFAAYGANGIGLCLIGLSALGWRYSGTYCEKQITQDRDMARLMEQIRQISKGELLFKADISEGSIFHQYSKELENIGSGMDKAIDKQLKGERLKIDLITNVSHDLKTPLTSIIGYVDLLSKDETLSPEAKDYVAILYKKTDRLKEMIADLFELAKSTSGEAKVDLEEMDMKRLVEQTLGDMSDKIEQAGMAIRFKCNAENTKFMGDVNRLYRVVQNVTENALKYSLKGTRIYMDVAEGEDNLTLTVINTASYEMDFSEEDIMERFARGEKSRSSEGNGLGLSIADSFTRNCGGDFNIFVNGDQFKVVISFTKITN